MRALRMNPAGAGRQQGVVLIISLVVLVAMSIAAIALMRSADIATRIAGNLAFRQSGAQAADLGMEVAAKWLVDTANLSSDVTPNYYSSWNGGVKKGNFDPLTFDWSKQTAMPTDAAGNTSSYVIHRLCAEPGFPGGITMQCITKSIASKCTSKSSDGCNPMPPPSSTPYYRITVRVLGPRNTVTYTQALVY